MFQIYILGNTTDDNPWKALDELSVNITYFKSDCRVLHVIFSYRPRPVVEEENSGPPTNTTGPSANPSEDKVSDVDETKTPADDTDRVS